MSHRTAFQKKLVSYTWGRKAPGGHWFLADTAPKFLRVPLTGEIVNLKRAAYAAFKEDIPENVDLRTNCGASGCICPWHQSFSPSRRESRSLSLPDVAVAQAGYSAIAEHDRTLGNVRDPEYLPAGLNPASYDKIKFLMRTNGINGVAAAVALPVIEVVRAANGAYDRAIAAARKRQRDRENGGEEHTKKKSTRREIREKAAAVGSPSSSKEISPEDQDWLRTVS